MFDIVQNLNFPQVKKTTLAKSIFHIFKPRVNAITCKIGKTHCGKATHD